MATVPGPHVNGYKPVNGITNSSDDPLPEVENFLEAITSLSGKDGFRKLADLKERVALKDAELQEKGSRISDLEKELAALKVSHATYITEQYSNFEKRYGKWGEEKASLQRAAETLKTASEKKDKTIATLDEELKKCQSQVAESDKACAAMTKNVKSKSAQIGELEAQKQNVLTSEAKLKDILRKTHANTDALKKSLEEKVKENQELKAEGVKAEKLIKEYKRFTVKIEPLNLNEVVSQTELLWQSAVELVCNSFGRDLPANVLENNWTKLNDNKVFKHKIPLPQTNSTIAKQMRVAVIVGALAKLVIKFLFQPNYLLEEGSGLRALLCSQATKDPVKELYTRGILLSMPHENQDEIDEDKVEFIIEDMIEVVGINVLVAANNNTFAEALEDLLIQFQMHWKRIQRARQKIEPSMASYPAMTEGPWYTLNLQSAPDDPKRTARSATTVDVEHDTIIIPPIVHIQQELKPTPITKGWVLQKTHIDAATEEIRNIHKALATAAYEDEVSSLSRGRRKRAMSNAAETLADRRKTEAFLR